jgi:hypothetical protein
VFELFIEEQMENESAVYPCRNTDNIINFGIALYGTSKSDVLQILESFEPCLN